MLDDAHKPLRGPAGKPAPAPVDLRPKRAGSRSGAARLRRAMDQTSIYALSQDPHLSDAEKAATRATLQERFAPGARSLPATVAGLQSVASQRIEDAIARGQFRHIPRGKGVGVERDHNASSPFLDTTEYFMNKIIKRQDILPPWVEKQNELTTSAARFRGRLRAEWKRHAARQIASKGGGLAEQVRRAEAYARAEERENPRRKKEEVLTTISSSGALTTVTVEEKPGSAASEASTITVTETSTPADGTPGETVEATASTKVESIANAPPDPDAALQAAAGGLAPFRDPAWEAAERAYHVAAVNELNSLTRSYNLMAPNLAKKAYFDLGRELRACYADVAPELPAEIRHRAEMLRARVEIIGHRPGGLMDKFSATDRVRVFESKKPHYGFKEFWRDMFGGKKQQA